MKLLCSKWELDGIIVWNKWASFETKEEACIHIKEQFTGHYANKNVRHYKFFMVDYMEKDGVIYVPFNSWVENEEIKIEEIK